MELDQGVFDSLRGEIQRLCGLQLGDEKRYLVRQRLEPLVAANGFGGFGELSQALLQGGNPALRDQVVAAITTHETSFFRDGHPFDAVREFVLPRLAATISERKHQNGQRRGAKVNILCAGASTGQEPYSVAMLIHEFAASPAAKGAAPEDFAILAVDVSPEVLATAMTGRYNQFEVGRGLPPSFVERYFTQVGPEWVVKKTVQELISFRKVNLIESIAALGSFDVIFCRNVLIYFDDAVKRRIVEQFRQMLVDDGLLLVGSSETLLQLDVRFESVHYRDTTMYQPIKG